MKPIDKIVEEAPVEEPIEEVPVEVKVVANNSRQRFVKIYHDVLDVTVEVDPTSVEAWAESGWTAVTD